MATELHDSMATQLHNWGVYLWLTGACVGGGSLTLSLSYRACEVMILQSFEFGEVDSW